MLSVMVQVREGIGGLHVRSWVYEDHEDGCRTLLAEQDYYPHLPAEVLDLDPLVAACVAIRQWSVRTIGSQPFAPTGPQDQLPSVDGGGWEAAGPARPSEART